jgi:phosphoglycerate kinase
MIGWPHIIAGPLVNHELKSVKRLFEPKRPSIWLVGGAKAPDKYKALKYNLEAEHIDKALISGITCYLFLLAKGVDLGEGNLAVLSKEAKDLDTLRADAEELYANYSDKIVLPVDFAYEKDGERMEVPIEELGALGISTGDIGEQTIELFKHEIEQAATVIANGPPGIFEKATLKKGTDSMIEAMAKAIDNDIFVEVGGGDMGEACLSSPYGYKFKFTSTAGGALLEILSGKELPLIKVLREKKPPNLCP